MAADILRIFPRIVRIFCFRYQFFGFIQHLSALCSANNNSSRYCQVGSRIRYSLCISIPLTLSFPRPTPLFLLSLSTSHAVWISYLLFLAHFCPPFSLPISLPLLPFLSIKCMPIYDFTRWNETSFINPWLISRRRRCTRAARRQWHIWPMNITYSLKC